MSDLQPPPIQALASALKKPRAAFAYGIDTRELRHNAFLHFLLGPLAPDGFKKRLIKEIATVAAKTKCQAAEWQSLADAEIKTIVPRYNVTGRAGRPDEVVECISCAGNRYVAVIEMKVKAAGGLEQLKEYVRAENGKSENHKAIVAGLLLRIPGRDSMPHADVPVLSGAKYQDCLQVARATFSGEPDDFSKLLDDYVSTLRFLDCADKAVLESGDWLRDFHTRGSDGSLLSTWVTDNWRWICERLMREVVSYTNGRFQNWKGEAYDTKDGAAADFELTDKDGLHVRFDDDGASLYCHWKLGVGFEIRAITKDYHEKPTDTSRSIMVRLCNSVQSQSEFEKWKRVAPRADKNSCMVARLDNSTHSVHEICEQLSTLLAHLEPVLRATVRALQA